MNSLTDTDRKILEFISSRQLITKGELRGWLDSQGMDRADLSLQRLKDIGFVEKVESLGTCFVVTARGARALKGT